MSPFWATVSILSYDCHFLLNSYLAKTKFVFAFFSAGEVRSSWEHTEVTLIVAVVILLIIIVILVVKICMDKNPGPKKQSATLWADQSQPIRLEDH